MGICPVYVNDDDPGPRIGSASPDKKPAPGTPIGSRPERRRLDDGVIGKVAYEYKVDLGTAGPCRVRPPRFFGDQSARLLLPTPSGFGNRARTGYSDTFFEAGWMDGQQARAPIPKVSATLRASRLSTLPLCLGSMIARNPRLASLPFSFALIDQFLASTPMVTRLRIAGTNIKIRILSFRAS
jgi:hypothetical protein